MWIMELKEKSREQLKKNWYIVVLATIIYAGTSAIVMEVTKGLPSIFELVKYAVIAILDFVYLAYFINIIKHNVDINKLLLKTNVLVKSIIIKLIQCSVFVVTVFFSDMVETLPENISLMNISLFILFTIILFIAAIIVNFIYIQAPIIIIENPKMSVINALKESNRLMEGEKSKYALFIFSFTGLFVLSILTFGIGLLWLIPYIQMASINYYYFLKKNKEI